MPKVTAAEWSLSLFTTADRATAIAGDLVEQGRASWFNILRTAAALFLKSAAGHAGRLLLVVLLAAALRELTSWAPFFLNRSGIHLSGWYAWVWAIVSLGFIGFLTARLARGWEMTACLTFAAVGSWPPLRWLVYAAFHSIPISMTLRLVDNLVWPWFVLAAIGAFMRRCEVKRTLRHAGS